MLGAIAGDIIGSIYENRPVRTKDFPLFGRRASFTDDTVCTVAVADCVMSGSRDFAGYLRAYVRRHPRRGYGGMFRRWALSPAMPAYGSWGNGAPMRVSAIAHLAQDEPEALDLAARSAAVSHDHPDAIAGAQAVVLAMWLARAALDKAAMRATLEQRFGYPLGEPLGVLRARYGFDVSAKGTVPPALIAALDAEGYEDAVRNAISLGGDADTLACIAGGLAEVLYGLPATIAAEASARLTPDLATQVERFYARTAGARR